MTNTEISTLVKAGYVVVTAEGQTQENLKNLSDIFFLWIDNLTPQHIKDGEDMTMKKMVENLKSFSQPHTEASIVMKTIVGVFEGDKSNKLAVELEKILMTKQYSPYDMPELAARIKTESILF